MERGKRRERRREARSLGVPIRPDLIPIGCPNLSRLRASIGKSGAGTDGGGDGGRETRGGRVRGNRGEERRGFPRAAATEENTLLIETKERKIAVETSERMNERVRVSFRFSRGARRPRRKKMSPFPASVGFAPHSPWKSERNRERKKKKGKSYVTCPRVPGQNVIPRPIEDENP